MDIDITPATTDLVVLDGVTDLDTTENEGTSNLAIVGVVAATAVAGVVAMKFVVPAVHGWLVRRLTPSAEQIEEAAQKIDAVLETTPETTEEKAV